MKEKPVTIGQMLLERPFIIAGIILLIIGIAVNKVSWLRWIGIAVMVIGLFIPMNRGER